MLFLFSVGIDLSILPEPVKLFFILCTSEFGVSLVNSFRSSLFFFEMSLWSYFLTEFVAFLELYFFKVSSYADFDFSGYKSMRVSLLWNEIP
jgi:hypothetical protein